MKRFDLKPATAAVTAIIIFCISACNNVDKSEKGVTADNKYEGYEETYNKSGVVILMRKDNQDGCRPFVYPDTSNKEPTSYLNIWNFNQRLRRAANPEHCNGYIPWDLQNFPSHIRIKVKEGELGNLLKHKDASELLAVFGIDAKNRFTVSFLISKEGEVHPEHVAGLKGEETWPDKSIYFIGEKPEERLEIDLPNPREIAPAQ